LLKWNTNDEKGWLTLEELTAKFRGLCEEYKVVGLTGSQVNRGVEANRRIVKLEDVAYSYGKIYTADFAVAITPPNPLQVNATHSILYLAKNRRGPIWLQAVQVDYGAISCIPVDISTTSFEGGAQ
jgi:hypothetical protein